MKKGLVVLVLGAAVVVAVVLIYKYYAAVNRRPAKAVTKTVVVPSGYTTGKIATLLAGEGIIAEARPFVWHWSGSPYRRATIKRKPRASSPMPGYVRRRNSWKRPAAATPRAAYPLETWRATSSATRTR